MKADGDTLWLHQSDLSHFMSCPDQFRVVNGVLPGGDFNKDTGFRMETDAATVGTVFHSVIEHDLTHGFKSLSDAERWAKNEFGNLVFSYVTDGLTYRTESFGDDPVKAIAALCALVDRWWHSPRRQHLKALAEDDWLLLEHEFDVGFIKNRKGRYKNIRLAGTMDVLNRYDHEIEDHKSSSSDHNHKRWEKQRWNLQSTVYTYAAAEQGLIQRHENGYKFVFSVYTYKNGSVPTHIDVWRDTGQWGWLTQLVSNMVATIESDMEVWPLRDDTALCSPKWCPVWDSCKGTFVSHPSWK